MEQSYRISKYEKVKEQDTDTKTIGNFGADGLFMYFVPGTPNRRIVPTCHTDPRC